MASCVHIRKVFQDEKSKAGFIKACNVAKYIILHSKRKDRLIHMMTCSDCLQIGPGSVFVCLQCSFCGCWNEAHFMAHSKKSKHLFGVNSSNGLVFCFECGDYIADSELIMASVLIKSWDDVSTKTQIPSMVKRDGLYGMVNLGSTCYMSSVLQCLLHNTYFIKYAMYQSHYKVCKIQDPRSCISCALDQIVTELYGSANTLVASQNDSKIGVNSNDGFINLITCSWKINENLAGYSQQDAHEFWQFLLNRIHHDYKLGKNETVNLVDDIPRTCECISHSTFQGFLKSSIYCPECKDNSKTSLEPFMDLSLDIKNKLTLYDCLDSFHKMEELHDFDYHCKQCNTSQNAIKQLTISKLPPVLILQLKRFEHLHSGTSVKLDSFVEFPLYLDMGKYCEQDQNGRKPEIIYELISIVCHIGTVNEGHYIAMCKLNNGQWYKFNDSMVSYISQEDVLKERAYLLMYAVHQIN